MEQHWPPTIPTRAIRHLGRICSARPSRRPVQIPRGIALPRLQGRQSRSLRFSYGNSTSNGFYRLEPGLRMERSKMDVRTRRPQLAARADVDLRIASWVMAACPRRQQPLAHLSRSRAATRGVHKADGLYAHRIPAVDRTPVLWIVGLPDNRILCADEPLRHAAGPDVSDRLSSRARDSRDSGLGAFAFPYRRLGIGIFRRNASLRTFGSS